MQPVAPCLIGLIRLITFFFLLGCTRPSQEHVATTAATESNDELTGPGAIYIQFVDKPEFNSTLMTETKKSTGRLDYVAFYDHFEREGFRFNDIAKNKAATYSTQSDWVMVRRYLGFFDYQDFLVHKGDSLVMSFDPGKPVILKHSMATYAPQDLNVETVINKKHPGTYLTAGMADDTRMVAFKYFYDDPNEGKKQLVRKGHEKGLYLEELENKMGGDLLAATKNIQHKSQQILDSLRTHHQISEHTYNFYQQKYANLLLKLEIMSGSLDSAQAASELNTRYKKQHFQDDYFNQCLNNFEKKYITSRAKWTVVNQFHLRDPRESFGIATNSSLLSPAVKDQLLFTSLNKVDQYFPDETGTYLKRFIELATDSTLVRQAQAKFEKDELLSRKPSNLHLLTLNREQITIEELLASKKGKVVYLDFWASWCAPCIEEMPHSRNLLHDYDKKGVEVVFFSLDNTYMKWSKASERIQVNLAMNSFKILKPENSKFLQEHKLKSIPRYMVIGKDGRVINADAPRPSDPKVRELLDRALKE